MDEGFSYNASIKVEGDTLTLQGPGANGANFKVTHKRLK